MPKISVVLPVYNAERYLRQCLQSIAAQTLRDIEIICVNDGSTDGSLDIIRSFAEADDRFKVVDKENGGYGQSLNRGIAQATGDYISIVEPDDFISSHMLEDLWAYTTYEGKAADVVKGSYWQFFDSIGNQAEQIYEPDLSKCMPRVPKAFTLEEDPEIFCHHPSIWSAIYRRAFLTENDISFIEPRGAGWADNPFLAETLLSAKRIVWVPGNYYFYRQTNAGSSSNLKDYRIPFDRLREMREIMKRKSASPALQARFYIREFDYIYEVIDSFDLNGSEGRAIRGLIGETLACMDAPLLHADPASRLDDIRFYNEFMALYDEGREASVCHSDPSTCEEVLPPQSPGGANNASVTYVIPVGNNGSTVFRCIRALLSNAGSHTEIMCVDAGSTDLSMSFCHALARTDSRIVCPSARFDNAAEALLFAGSEAHGRYVCPISASTAATAGLQQIEPVVLASGSDVLLLDQQGRFYVEAHRARCMAGEQAESDRMRSEDDSVIVMPPSAMAGFIFNCERPGGYTMFFNRKYIQQAHLAKNEADICGNGLFGCEALIGAHTVAYSPTTCFEEIPAGEGDVLKHGEQWGPDEQQVPHFTTPLMLYLVSSLSGEQEALYGTSLRNRLIESFACDLGQCGSSSMMQAFCDEYLSAVRAAVDGSVRIETIQNANAYRAYRLVCERGVAAYANAQLAICEQGLMLAKRDYRKLDQSAALQLGRKIGAAAHTLAPTGAINALRRIVKKQ